MVENPKNSLSDLVSIITRNSIEGQNFLLEQFIKATSRFDPKIEQEFFKSTYFQKLRGAYQEIERRYQKQNK